MGGRGASFGKSAKGKIYGSEYRNAFENGEKAAKLYKNATLVPIEHADHCFVGHEKELYNAIIRFL